MSSSTVTDTSVYTHSEPGRVFWRADEEPSNGAPPSPDYVPGPEHPPSPDYVPDPEHPPPPTNVPYVPYPEYPEYLVPSDDETPMEDQPLLVDASPPSDDDDDDDTNDEDEEPFEEEDDDDKEEEHLAPADSSAIPVVDLVPSDRDTEAFKTDESAPIPRSPQTNIPFSQIRLRRAQKTVKLELPMSPSMEARIAKYVVAPTPPSLPPSPLSPWSSSLSQILSPPLPVSSLLLPLPSPLTTSLTDVRAPLGYREAGIQMRATSPPLLLPSTSHRTDILKAEMPPRKRACFTTHASGLEIGESLAAGAVRQPGTTLEANLRRDRDTKEFQATYARRAWTGSEDRSAAIEDHVRTLKAQVATLIAQTSSLQTQLITVLRRIKTLESRDPEP
ncbi:hypothetical protein Tco_0773548 [Tanacetum coccineum]|uniref:Uncharacterized protein n=1 Tax=Tanacetum coccineum TaxID=301880 RepID=A0ABQ4ZPR3_9ASTR